MKEDKLEKFMRENRGQFDVYDPDPGIWHTIRPARKLKEEKPVNWKVIGWRGVAAGIIFILSLLIAEYLLQPYGPLSRFPFAQRNDVLIPELQEAEIYYASQLQLRLQDVQDYLTEYPGLESELIRDFQAIDSIQNELRKDLKDNISNRDVVEALIQNYRIKVTILEDLLQHFEYAEGEKNDENINHEL
jgi:hypothetical protein